VEAELVLADGQTDRQKDKNGEADSRFSQIFERAYEYEHFYSY